jgi:AcrR family transcriptional regulator
MAIQETVPAGSVRRGGRPSRREAEECLRRVHTIAQRHFLSLGYNGTSLDTIAREAGVAKKTLYHHFGNKAGLFTEIVSSFRRTRIAELADIVLGAGTPEKVLTDVALHLLDVFTRPERVKLHKLFLFEARRFPKLVRVLYDSRGSMCGMEPLSNYLREAVAKGIFAIDDENLATEQFVHIVLGGVRDRVIVGVMRRPNLVKRRRIAQQAVRIFLSGTYAGTVSGRPGA